MPIAPNAISITLSVPGNIGAFAGPMRAMWNALLDNSPMRWPSTTPQFTRQQARDTSGSQPFVNTTETISDRSSDVMTLKFNTLPSAHSSTARLVASASKWWRRNALSLVNPVVPRSPYAILVGETWQLQCKPVR